MKAFALALLLTAAPAAQAQTQDILTGVTSTQSGSAVSVSIDPTLSDGRLVLRIAVQNRTSASIKFGPADIRIVQTTGETVALTPLDSLIGDVRRGAGLSDGVAVATQPAPAMVTTNTGQKDVSGYTGNMGAPAGLVQQRRADAPLPPEVEAQIAGLKAGILTDAIIAPGDILARQAVTTKLKFRKASNRDLIVSISVAGEIHNFSFAAPRR
jgi:hypothetical protein